MNELATLVWWKVSKDATLQHNDATMSLPDLGIPPPAATLPQDAFRRLGTVNTSWDWVQGQRLELSLHKAEAQRTMMVRHIVLSTYKKGVAIDHTRVGEAVFYKPTRGRPSQSRMRVAVNKTAASGCLPTVEEFAEGLRREYRLAMGAIDSQGIRRIVRNHLASVGALYVDGAYIVRGPGDASPLMQLLDPLDGCSLHHLPIYDEPGCRAMIEDALRAAVQRGDGVRAVESWTPAGVVPEDAWSLLEEQANAGHEPSHQTVGSG